MTHVNMCEFSNNQRIFTEVIMRMDRQMTDRQTDRQTEVINTFQLQLESVKNRKPVKVFLKGLNGELIC